jgi:hypothetical protein
LLYLLWFLLLADDLADYAATRWVDTLAAVWLSACAALVDDVCTTPAGVGSSLLGLQFVAAWTG